MSYPVQNVFPGILADAWNEELQRFARENTVARLWNQDSSLWPAEERHIPSVKSNLRWLNLPEQIEPYLSKVMDSVRAVQESGLEHFVFVAMGSSNLAGAAALDLPETESSRQMLLLDSTDTDAIRDVESKVSLDKTLFVFANKSGKRIETHCLLLYFLNKLKAAGVKSPGKQFIAMTERNSYLAALALEYKFRDIFFDPPGISSHYSGLIHFSLVMAAAHGVEPRKLLETIGAVRDACREEAPAIENPAVALASFLAAGERTGLNRLILLTRPELFYFAYRIAHLTGTSTSTGGRGFIPIFGQENYALATVKEKCVAVTLSLGNRESAEATKFAELRDAGLPTVEIKMRQPADFAAEIFKWEVATALACASMGLNPFLEGATQGNIGVPAQALEDIAKKRHFLMPSARVTAGAISLYAEGRSRRRISNLSLREALRTFLELRNQDSYIAILPFFKLIPEYVEIVQDMRDHMRYQLEMPVQVSSGPRYIHALGKIYKEGPANGIFIVITAEPRGDLAIPGADYTFGQLHLALAMAEAEALENASKPTVRLHLADGAEKGLKELRDVVIQAVAQITRNAG